MVQTVALGLVIAAVAAWILFAAALWFAARRYQVPVAEAARVLPDTLRLLRALARDRSLPRSIRRRLGFALVYCGQPLNLIPDFIPVIGYADNVVVAAWALRSVVRIAGQDAVERQWRGSPAGLALLRRALRLQPSPGDSSAADRGTTPPLS